MESEMVTEVNAVNFRQNLGEMLNQVICLHASARCGIDLTNSAAGLPRRMRVFPTI